LKKGLFQLIEASKAYESNSLFHQSLKVSLEAQITVPEFSKYDTLVKLIEIEDKFKES